MKRRVARLRDGVFSETTSDARFGKLVTASDWPPKLQMADPDVRCAFLVMAQLLATVDELTDGRLTLAPGACTKSHARVHALPTEVGATPSEVLREYIESMRLLLSGEKVSYHGKFVNFDNVGLGWKPIRTKIPFYVPATATVGLRLAGEIGDGVILNASVQRNRRFNA